jgi:excinuclease UvrABC ATPase subunit
MHDFDPNRVVPDETKSLAEGAIVPWAKGDRKLVREAIAGLAKSLGFDPATAFANLARKYATRSSTAATARASRASSRIFAGGSTRRHGPSRKTSTCTVRCGRARRVTAIG